MNPRRFDRLVTGVRALLAWVGQSRARQVASVAFLLAGLVALTGTGYGYEPFDPAEAVPAVVQADAEGPAPTLAKLRARQRQLRASVLRATPRGRYIVVDQTNNRLFLRDSEKVLLDASCSAGSGFVLRESGETGREWVFDTPRGRFEVLTRIRNPIWRKPDWAFVEEGEPIPKKVEDRLEPGTLGEYALYFGNGFMIHGTLYERLLGRSVTHGCVRLGRDDLRTLWANAPVGTAIYIF
jgi:lipoprotein-anchoring transpeptidase ErfK/SrfK